MWKCEGEEKGGKVKGRRVERGGRGSEGWKKGEGEGQRGGRTGSEGWKKGEGEERREREVVKYKIKSEKDMHV